MNQKIRVGLIGSGGMAKSRSRCLKESIDAGYDIGQLTAVCDLIEERAHRAADMAEELLGHRPRVFTDYRRMLDEDIVDAVDVVTDHKSHHTIVNDSLEAGLHCLVEKPLAITIRAARSMLDTARRTGKLLGVAENYRRAVNQRARRYALDQGLLGEPKIVIQIGISGRPPQVVVGTPWRHRKLDAGMGWVLDMGVHETDLFRYLVGDVKQVFGSAKKLTPARYFIDALGIKSEALENSVEDAAFALLEFECGATGVWGLTSTGQGGEATSVPLTIYGEEGCLKGDTLFLDGGRRIEVEEFYKDSAPTELKRSQFPGGLTNPVTLEQLEFLRAISGDVELETDGQAGLEAMAISCAVIESSEENLPLQIADVLQGRHTSYQDEINDALDIR